MSSMKSWVRRLRAGYAPCVGLTIALVLMTGCSGIGVASGTGTANGTGGAVGTGTATDTSGKTFTGTGAVVGTGTVSGTGTVAGVGSASEGTATPETPSGILLALGLVPLILTLTWWRRQRAGAKA